VRELRTRGVSAKRPSYSRVASDLFLSLKDLFEDGVEIRWQGNAELQTAAVTGMGERQACGMQERSL
jgi:hypothetical protein